MTLRSDSLIEGPAHIPPFDWLMPLAPWEDPEVLRQTLISLKQQTWQARALVVSVDGQISQPLEMALQESGLPVEIYQSEQWQGTGPVLARGLEACRSEIVLRVDADDVSVPERSRWQVRQMLSDPLLAVLGGQLEELLHFNKPPDIQRLRRVPCRAVDIKKFSNWRNPINHPTVAMRRSMALSAGNYRSCPYFEDWDLWLRMLRKGYILRNDYRVLVKAQVGHDHLSRRHGRRYARDELSFLLRSARSSLIPVHCAIVLCLLRVPLRLVPKPILGRFFGLCMRSYS
jgi:glycosyltransferase involved in cell wall biosynthesis